MTCPTYSAFWLDLGAAVQVVNFWAGYQRRVETDPVPTKAMTSFLGFVIGDFFAQNIEGGAYNIFRYKAYLLLTLRSQGLF